MSKTQAPDPAPSMSFSDAVRIASGCKDYGGGYRGTDYFEAYQHGIATVVASLRAAAEKGLQDTQVRALHTIGADSAPAIPAPEGAQLPPLPHPLLIAGGGQSWFNAEQMRAYARAALAAPAPQDSLDSAQPSNQVAMQAAPVALTNEQIAYSCCEIMLSEHPIDYDIAIGRAVIAEFCRVNGIPAPQTKEPKA